MRLFNITGGDLFKITHGYVLKATKPCAVAYSCARIRRLVCRGPWFYRFRVADHSAVGLGNSTGKRHEGTSS
jgi:hypothetical protein